jgi:hypothetical protein
MEERTQISRSLEKIGAAGMSARGDSRVAGGAEVCAKPVKAVSKKKKLAVRCVITCLKKDSM